MSLNDLDNSFPDDLEAEDSLYGKPFLVTKRGDAFV